MARVPLLRKEDLPDQYQYLLETDALGERNIFRAMGNNPTVMQSYMRYGTVLWEESGLSFRDRELVILSVARTLQSRYEWHQHVDIAREAEITRDELLAINRGEHANFDDSERALLAYAASFATGDVTDADHAALAEHFDAKTIAGIAMLASHYVATARVLDAFDVPVEGSFVGWDVSNG